MDATIEIEDGTDELAELESLSTWLIGVAALRGAVRLRSPRHAGEMGGVADVLVVALGSGGAITALAASLGTWLVTRRSHLTIKVTNADGTSVELDVKQAKGDQADVAALLREALGGQGTDNGDGATT